ncbi:MAG: hypothetical protein ACYS21_13640, partial [Planctomycetota bacterium]
MKRARAAGAAPSTVMVILLTLVWAAVAEVPQKLYYQAILTDDTGAAVTSPTQVIFTIWDAETVGTALWAETLSVSPSATGQFSQILGEVHAITEEVLTGEPMYLGVQVGSDAEMSPRTELVSGPYAMRVATVDGSKAGQVFGELEIASNDGPASLLILGPDADSIQISPGDGIVLRATDSVGNERVVISTAQESEAILTIRNPNGESVEFSTGGQALSIYDANGNLRIDVGLIEGGGAVSFWEPGGKSGSAVTKKVELRREGLVMFGETEADTMIYALPNGNIRGQGQIAMGTDSLAGRWSTVFGFNNDASGDSATISGGYDNTAAGHAATVGGGNHNRADSGLATVGGGMG